MTRKSRKKYIKVKAKYRVGDNATAVLVKGDERYWEFVALKNNRFYCIPFDKVERVISDTNSYHGGGYEGDRPTVVVEKDYFLELNRKMDERVPKLLRIFTRQGAFENEPTFDPSFE